MKTLLISLVSDQTLPNVQLIKEFQKEVDNYLFITTDKMEKKGCRRWIEKATNIHNSVSCIVQEFSFDNITEKLDEIDFTIYNRIIVNLTGGTKITTLSAHDYFKEMGAEIYYVTGTNNEYIKIFPGRKKLVKQFTNKITIKDYLNSYGFNSDIPNGSGINTEYTKKLFNNYQENGFKDYVQALSILRKKRNDGIKNLTKVDSSVNNFLSSIDFIPSNENILTKAEVRYLTGEWLEEYVGAVIKEELHLSNEEILTGVVLEKESLPQETNSVKRLLGDYAPLKEKRPDNEIDVMFTYNNRFYTVECKTSIIDLREVGVNESGEKIVKEVNILGETIYKADYLKNRFGLFAHSTILTLTDFPGYINASPNVLKNRTKQMEDLINRCSLSGIKLIDGNQIKNEPSISKLIFQ